VVPSGVSAPQPPPPPGPPAYPQPPAQTLAPTPTPLPPYPSPTVSPPVAPPPPQNGNLQSGLFIQRMTDVDPHGTPSTFTPTPEVLLMPFPATQALAFQSGGVDGTNRAAMEATSAAIHDRARVDACGTVLDSWQAELSGNLADARNAAAGGAGSKKFDL